MHWLTLPKKKKILTVVFALLYSFQMLTPKEIQKILQNDVLFFMRQWSLGNTEKEKCRVG